ncbi:hypothetical protein VNO78_33332 [Psophocarpus tetragonolobus]|uniref:Uncharacterized protein n=1 Tax=Psophocarpus tetragonolobus TaxID=3891 RepID=A0AAN9P3W5_PSOTE
MGERKIESSLLLGFIPPSHAATASPSHAAISVENVEFCRYWCGDADDVAEGVLEKLTQTYTYLVQPILFAPSFVVLDSPLP